jgi:hypothetical protein
MDTTTLPKVEYILPKDNAFVVLAGFQRAARIAGWTPKQLDELTSFCTTGDYDHLISTIASCCTDLTGRPNA